MTDKIKLEDMSEVKRTERGWCGHFIGGDKCLFHRNTLLEYGKHKIVVSTVGRWLLGSQYEPVGCDRYFETMAFVAKENDKYHDADVCKRIKFKSEWSLPEPDMELEADAMHEAVVTEISQDLINDTLHVEDYETD